MPNPPVPPSPAELDDLLRTLAAQLIWWQPAEDSLRNPDRVIAQVLDLGTFEAGQRLRQVLGDRRLARSGAGPPLPRRHFGGCDGSHHAAD